MDLVLWLGRSYLVPGSPMFLLLGLLLGAALLARERTAALGRRALWLLVWTHVALSMPYVATTLARLLGGDEPLMRAEAVRDSEAIVLIGCGAITTGSLGEPLHLPGIETAFNISEAVRLYHLAGGHRIVVTGGIPPGGANKIPESDVIRDYLVRMGVDAAHLVLEPGASNTRQQAQNVAALLPRGARVVLVTVPTHMPRTAAFFRAQGLQVTPAVSSLAQAERARTFGGQFIPSRYALRASERAMYEVVGLTYYWLVGAFRG